MHTLLFCFFSISLQLYLSNYFIHIVFSFIQMHYKRRLFVLLKPLFRMCKFTCNTTINYLLDFLMKNCVKKVIISKDFTLAVNYLPSICNVLALNTRTNSKPLRQCYLSMLLVYALWQKALEKLFIWM